MVQCYEGTRYISSGFSDRVIFFHLAYDSGISEAFRYHLSVLIRACNSAPNI